MPQEVGPELQRLNRRLAEVAGASERTSRLLERFLRREHRRLQQ